MIFLVEIAGILCYIIKVSYYGEVYEYSGGIYD